ncbi:MAG: hypothetical protein GY782_07230 [Gammaproteobacteria bacterium]|nr:hypothetical protein [Gammaproteobacteria bacterium]
MQKSNNQLNITPELLNLSDIEITNVELTSQGEFHIHVKSTKKEVPCHQCNQPTSPNGSSYSPFRKICNMYLIMVVALFHIFWHGS